ncbi:hypothetical protein IEQ34_008339 [Dendrobium chrysotoxum]|uniref:Uncharacterized protein n=1 Tax=Dendrobium chrysotoxum TaxID=161865 RepID=A0AAV7GYC3_DENCH|nr:hypothetical protein IEQ34_008339 [Dendrobium chrysotoxum]
MLDNVLRSKLKEHMHYCMDHPDEINKLAKVQAQVSEVKGVMMENIEKLFFSATVAIIFKHQQTAQMKELEVDLTKEKMGEPLGKAADGKLKKNVVPEFISIAWCNHNEVPIEKEEILEDWKLQVMKPPRQLVVPAEKAQMRKQVVVRRLKSHAVLDVLPKTYGIGEEDEQTIYY